MTNNETAPQSQDNSQQWDALQSVPFAQNAENASETAETKNSFAEITEAISNTDLTVYERLNASNDKAAKEEFLSNPSLVHPNNEYANLDPKEVARNLAALAKIKDEIAQADLTEQQKRFLNMLRDDCYLKNDFLLANIEYHNATTPEEKAAAIAHHHEANEALYGKVDEDTFYALLKAKIDKINVDSLSPEDRARYDKLIADIGPIKESTGGQYKPSQETLQRFGELVQEFFGNFLKHIPEDQQEFTGADAARIFNEILTEEFSDEPDANATAYQAVTSENAGNASANHEKRQLIFPEGATYTREKLASLILHELGTHTLRAIPYVDQDIAAFSTAFPNNESFDEGVAVCVEQALKGKLTEPGFSHYINIGLATFKGKNFREIYDIRTTLNDLAGESNKVTLNGVQRCFRGTGELVNNKDLVYYNGAEAAWKYIEQHLDDPELFDNLFLVGKLDITNPEHAAFSYDKRTGKL